MCVRLRYGTIRIDVISIYFAFKLEILQDNRIDWPQFIKEFSSQFGNRYVQVRINEICRV